MPKPGAAMLLAVMAAACGGTPSRPTSFAPPAAVGGTWSGTFSVTSLTRVGTAPIINRAVPITVAIHQSDGSASGEFAAIGLMLAFSGELGADSFQGSLRMTGGDGCSGSAPFEGRVSPAELHWTATMVVSQCGWSHLVQLRLTDRVS